MTPGTNYVSTDSVHVESAVPKSHAPTSWRAAKEQFSPSLLYKKKKKQLHTVPIQSAIAKLCAVLCTFAIHISAQVVTAM